MLSIEERLRRYEPFFGEWELGENVELLGKGQSSYVFTIHHKNDMRTAALKVISIPMDEAVLKRLKQGGTPEQVQALLKRDYAYARREIETMDLLNGTSNIVYFENSAIYERTDLGDGLKGWDVLIRMEKLIPFERYLKNIGSKRTTALVLRIWDELLEGLKACQSQKIVHLDIKPQNIFYAPGTDYFKLGDFSEAQRGELVAVNCKFGTRGYIPPEIEAKRGGDGRADLYSLALVIYSLLNNDYLPFIQPGAQNMNAELDRADKMRWSGQTIPRIKGLNSEIMDILVRCLECDPERRYRSAAEVQNALRKIMYRDNSRRRKFLIPLLIAVTSLSIAGVLVLFGVSSLRNNQPVSTAPSADGQASGVAVISAEAGFEIENGAARGGQKYVYEGTAEPKAEMNVLLNGEVIDSVQANSRGAWSVSIDEDLLAEAKECTVAFAYEDEALGGTPAELTLIYDNEVTPFSVNPVYTNSGLITGSAEAGAEITLVHGSTNENIGTAVAAEDNTFELSLSDGSVLSQKGIGEGHALVLSAEDALGNEASTRVVVLSPDDANGDVQAITIESDLVANVLSSGQQTIRIWGTAEPGATLEVYANRKKMTEGENVTVDAEGNWSYQLAVADIGFDSSGESIAVKYVDYSPPPVVLQFTRQ